MMLALQCLLFAVVAGSSSVEHITHPKRLLQQKHTTEEKLHSRLDTRVRDSKQETPVHLAQSSFEVEAFGRTFILDLQLNHNLLSSEYVERHFNDNGKPSQTMGGEHCYYHGSMRRTPGSWAALATCQGLYGVFSDGVFSYSIEPLINDTDQFSDAHLVKKIPNIKLTSSCSDCSLDEDDSVEELLSNPEHSEGLKRTKRRVSRPRVHTETKYIELMVINDFEMFVQLRRSTTQVRNFAKAVVNMADAIYKEQLNTRIVLVAMETWSSGNLVSVVSNPLMTLQNFMQYRRENLQENPDSVQLLSGSTFQSSRSGSAYTGGVCSITRGGGINEVGEDGDEMEVLSSLSKSPEC
ncbi:hypothetical protein AOLI_G00300070 [Acnodon oligacanthus]